MSSKKEQKTSMCNLDDLVDFIEDHKQKSQNDPNLFNALLQENHEEEHSVWSTGCNKTKKFLRITNKNYFFIFNS